MRKAHFFFVHLRLFSITFFQRVLIFPLRHVIRLLAYILLLAQFNSLLILPELRGNVQKLLKRGGSDALLQAVVLEESDTPIEFLAEHFGRIPIEMPGDLPGDSPTDEDTVLQVAKSRHLFYLPFFPLFIHGLFVAFADVAHTAGSALEHPLYLSELVPNPAYIRFLFRYQLF